MIENRNVNIITDADGNFLKNIQNQKAVKAL